jgi:SAM-dependent methyltransferase
VRRLLKLVPERLRASRRLRARLGFEETLWTRKVADEQVRLLVRALQPSTLSALEISGRVWEGFGFRRYRSVAFPDFDVCRDALPDVFDLIIAEHVFEHLPRPYAAGCNVAKMLAPGGHFLIVTPFLYKVHPNPDDCTRWTESGLKGFLAECGFPLESIRTGSWGNRECIEATFRREYRLFNRYLHTLTNNPELPMVVWALARR